MKFVQFIFVLFITLTIGFGGGYLFGVYRDKLGIEKEIYIATQYTDNFNSELLIYIYEVYGLKVIVQPLHSYNPTQTDLFLLSTQQLQFYRTQIELPDINTSIQSDFLKLSPNSKIYLPVAWSLDKKDNKPHVMTYYLVRNKNHHDKIIQRFLRIFTSEEIHQSWIETSNFNSALTLSNDFPEELNERKASYFRALSLSETDIESPQF